MGGQASRLPSLVDNADFMVAGDIFEHAKNFTK
jgi:hypothetical protein